MTTTSVQVRKVTERVNRYFKIFGYRSYSEIQGNRAKIKATKELGLEHIECRITETSRGTAVGFFPINTWSYLSIFIPFLAALLLLILDENTGLKMYISGESSPAGFNLRKLLVGDIQLNFVTVLVLMSIPTIFVVSNITIQRIRLDNLKMRFAFFTRDANWKPTDLSPNTIALKGAQTGFFHGWVLAIIYFSVLSMSQGTITEVTDLYSIDVSTLQAGLTEGFMIISGALTGLVSADKANRYREELSRTHRDIRYHGGLTERRIEPILFSLNSSAVTAIFLTMFISVTFIPQASWVLISYNFIGFVLAAVIAGYIREGGAIWFATAYGSILLFTALASVFRTGQEAEFAFVVIQQLFLLPFALIIVSGYTINAILEERRIKTTDHLYQLFPIGVFITLFTIFLREKKKKERYLKELEEEQEITDDEGRILISKENLEQRGGELAVRVARHYFELVNWYNSLFEDGIIVLPTAREILSVFREKTGKVPTEHERDFFVKADRLVWDYTHNPSQSILAELDKVGTEMVLKVR